jgi:hypothetical protein
MSGTTASVKNERATDAPFGVELAIRLSQTDPWAE